MMFILVMIAVLAAPPAMLAGLIVLAVKNSQKKQMILKLRQENEMLRQELGRGPWTSAGEGAEQAAWGQAELDQAVPVVPAQEYAAPAVPAPAQPLPANPAYYTHSSPAASPNQPLDQTALSRPLQQIRETNWQGTAALVMGVVFVILAGAIFATTAWHLLPNVGKVALVLAFSGIFFGASAIAQHKFHITGTGKAFYILGSVFLFVAALAVGFFGLLGPELTLWGSGRYLLLFGGTVMTETALLLGLKRFPETVYGGFCLFGITTAVMFLLASFHPGRTGFTAGMAVYGVAVVILAKVLRKQEYRNLPQTIAAAFPAFSLVNLWGISALVLLNLEWGMMSGAVTLLMAGLHLYLGETEEKGQTNTGTFALLLAAGVLRAASPDDADSWLYTGSLVLAILAAMSYMGLFCSQVKKILRYAGFGMAAVLLAGNAMTLLFSTEASLAGLICMGLLLLDATLLALEYRRYLFYSIHSVILAAFLHYLLFYLDIDFDSSLFVSSLIFGSLFLAARLSKTAFETLAGDILFVLIILFDTALLWLSALLSWNSVNVHLMTGAAVILLTAVLAVWSREYKKLRYVLPAVSAVLPWIVVTVMDRQFQVVIDCEMSLIIYLLILILWDQWKKDRFCPWILVFGTCCGGVYFLLDEISLPFLPVLALYLAVRHRDLPEKQRALSLCGAAVYLLAGAYAAYASCLDYEVTRQLAAAAVLGIQFLIWKKRGSELSLDLFFQIGFSLLYLTAMGAFYLDDTKVSLWYLLPLGLLFAAAYMYGYIRSSLNLHFLTAAVTLVLPVVLWLKYELSENQLYGVVMAAFAVTAVTARMKCPLVRFSGEKGKSIQADWYHVLFVLALLPMAMAAESDQWRTVYTLLTAAYVIQFVTVKPMARGAVTLAELICVLAFWIQPWIQWPELIRLEICLIPAVAVIWSLGKIWGNRRAVCETQSVLYTLCLLALAVDAYLTQRVADALILEVICLAVFTASCMWKRRRPAAISGATAVAVVIYMTRSFWLSISWWVYLLAAGIGLILFAAVNELKKH